MKTFILLLSLFYSCFAFADEYYYCPNYVTCAAKNNGGYAISCVAVPGDSSPYFVLSTLASAKSVKTGEYNFISASYGEGEDGYNLAVRCMYSPDDINFGNVVFASDPIYNFKPTGANWQNNSCSFSSANECPLLP